MVNWDAAGAVGEIIGAIAVVLTLFYLARQTRLNTAAINLASTQATLTGRSEATRLLANDPELAELLWRGSAQPDSLSEQEWQRFFLICGAIIRPLELAYLDFEAERMSAELWSGQKNTIAFWVALPGWSRWLEQYGQTLYPPFREYLLQVMQEERDA